MQRFVAEGIGTALVAMRLDHVWIYLLAPALGAGLAVLACRCVRGPQCCLARAAA